MATQSSLQLTPFQSPQPDFIIFGDFKLKKHLARPQTQLNIYRYVYIMDQADEMVIIGKFQNGTPKVTRKTVNIRACCNPVCCHGNITGILILWDTPSRIL